MQALEQSWLVARDQFGWLWRRYQIDIEKIKKKKSTKKTKAIFLFIGEAPRRYVKNYETCKKFKIHVVEDACMGIGAKLRRRSKDF